MQLLRPSRPGKGLWIRLAAVAAALGVVAAVAGGALAGERSHRNVYRQVNLISDIDGVARITDMNLVNPWGLAAGAKTPLWVADNGTDVSTFYTGGIHGSIPVPNQLVVSIPGGAPTGAVFNPTSDFNVGGAPAKFIFDSEAGMVTAWNGGNAAQTVQTVPDAIYKGLAIGRSSNGNELFASNFHAGTIDVFDSSFQPVKLPPGAFMDQNIPSGYGPFGIQELNGRLYVTYAKQDPDKEDDVKGPGLGFVDVYSNDGVLLRRVASMGPLNAPWGLVIAPRDFGPFSGDLLVGNFGDGAISAFDRRTGAFEGQLMNRDGNVIKINGLWGLRFGNGVFATPDDLVFSAGIGDEDHGLLGEIKVRNHH
jgi:uncharacterized protein (TIGR03118 family)